MSSTPHTAEPCSPAAARGVAPVAVPAERTPPPLSREARKWWRIFAVYAQDALMYRATALVWILTDTIPLLIMPLLWLSAYNGRREIAGFGPSQMTAYYLILLGVTNIIQCHAMWEIATDIKEGRFSAYLLRPFSYCAMNYLGFLSWRILRTVLFLPLFAIAAYLFRHSLTWDAYYYGWEFWTAILLGHFVSFFITYAFGLLALYFVETRSLFNFWYMPLILFSGQFAPLALFPPAARRLADILPYRYTVALPTEIFLGKLSGDDAHYGLLIQLAWIAGAYVLGVLLWRGGVKRFTGVGL